MNFFKKILKIILTIKVPRVPPIDSEQQLGNLIFLLNI